jgi:conjugal transfer pilus assembly protein TraE
MSLFFLTERLTVTPSTVKGQHQLLLSMTDSVFYANFSALLASEASAIEKQKISSVFYPQTIQVNPDTLSVVITGTLHRFVGERALAPTDKTYRLQYGYRQGQLAVREFSEMEGKTHEKI